MKIASILLPCSIVVVSLFSCSKEKSFETPANIVVNNPGDFHAVIDSTAWSAADSTRGASILDGIINISGISSDNKTISITLSDTITGTYTLNETSLNGAAYTENASANTYAFTTNQSADTSLAGGQVIISEIDRVNKTISGTFRLNVFREADSAKRKITAGVFNKIPYLGSLPVANLTDTFTVKIDGALFSPQSIIATATSGQIFIEGSNTDGTSPVALSMPQTITPGSYTLDLTAGVTYGLYNSPTTVLGSDSGTLVIVKNDPVAKRISGTFEFHAVDLAGTQSSTLSEGYFSVGYN